ncbi:MAG: type II toxin-antitoxin system prevent-host-death family antitoxin [Deferrisomatales bacterium]
MPEVGAYEAKTHLAQLLKRVEQGERFVITKHGRPVAELVPVAQGRRDAIQRAIEDLKTFQKEHSLGGVSVRDLIEEGRKY